MGTDPGSDAPTVPDAEVQPADTTEGDASAVPPATSDTSDTGSAESSDADATAGGDTEGTDAEASSEAPDDESSAPADDAAGDETEADPPLTPDSPVPPPEEQPGDSMTQGGGSPESLDPALVDPGQAAKEAAEGTTNDATVPPPPDSAKGDVEVATVPESDSENEFFAPLTVEDVVILANDPMIPARLVGRRAVIIDAPAFFVPVSSQDKIWVKARVGDEFGITISFPLSATVKIERGGKPTLDPPVDRPTPTPPEEPSEPAQLPAGDESETDPTDVPDEAVPEDAASDPEPTQVPA